MIKYPKTPQFKQCVRNVIERAQYYLNEDSIAQLDYSVELPVIQFTGTIKLHGTNSSLVYDFDSGLRFQSRNREITPEDDNAGFAAWGAENAEKLMDYIVGIELQNYVDDRYTIVVFGEWCGGNIQAGTAINGLDKMFVMFAARAVRTGDPEHSDSWWLKLTSPARGRGTIYPDDLYLSTDFGTYSLRIDFNHLVLPTPKCSMVTSELVRITNEVEAECPVGKFFGRVKGEDNTIGEGVVWSAIHEGHLVSFKVKGEKHTKTKVKKLVVVDIEKLGLVQRFVNEYACTASRLEQIFDEVMDTLNGGVPTIEKTGDFLKAFVNDVHAEESGQLEEMELTPKDVNRTISQTAKEWLFRQL